jgi:carboxyl-terminal processing protease
MVVDTAVSGQLTIACGAATHVVRTDRMDFGRIAGALDELRAVVSPCFLPYAFIDDGDFEHATISDLLAAADPRLDRVTSDVTEFEPRPDGAAGIGLVLTRDSGDLGVVRSYLGSPAADAGLGAGDRLLAVDGVSTGHMGVATVSRVLRGMPGTSVTVSVRGGKSASPYDLTVTRRALSNDPLTIGQVTGSVGYVRLRDLTTKTAQRLQEAVDRLRSEGATRLILDLRDNHGGPVLGLLATARPFLPAGAVVLTVEERRERRPEPGWTVEAFGDHVLARYIATEDGAFRDLPVVVAIGRGTTSGAEALAAILRDTGRATLVGDTTKGLGTIQSAFKLADPRGWTIRFTTGRVQRADRTILDGVGVTPDVPLRFESPSDEDPAALQRRIEHVVPWAS